MPLPALDLNALPLVLAGPIVRRVDAGSTTVWVALKAARKVTLEVWAGESSSGVPTENKHTGTAVTARIGANLHVVAVTATGPPLAPGSIHRYTLRFGENLTPPGTPVDSAGKGLFDAGIVAATPADARKALLYTETSGAPTLPSFITPPATPGGVRIMHGSCRKPHGEGRDGLAILNEILEDDIAVPARRPHQLLLTGDQVYADDVADVLLYTCMTRGAELLGRNEILPDFPNQEQRLRPGRRQTPMIELFHMSSEHAKSHLVTFAEFACMYLMAWSNVLWPARPLDLFPDIYPDEAARLGQPKGDMLFGLLVSKSYTHATATLNAFVTECDRLVPYVEALPDVRRALANTATYMMFDDHEVTDDWYITEQWVRDVAGTNAPLGRRLLANGLSAFAVFQAWGNVPERFGPTPAGDAGRAILAELAKPGGPDAATLEPRLGLPTGIVNGVPLRDAGAIDWHYRITWNSHQLVVLDTRTRRRFPGGPEAPPALILADADYAAMLPRAEAAQAVTIVVSPAPVIGLPLLDEHLQPRLAKDHEGILAYDGEAWSLQKVAYEKLVARLMTMSDPDVDGVRRHRVVLLSGDVHYGFTTRVNYTATRPYRSAAGRAEGVIAQFVSSSLKNQEAGFPKTEFLHDNDLVTSGIDRHDEAGGWDNPTGARLKVGEEWVPRGDAMVRSEFWVGGDPAMVAMDEARAITLTPEWRYTVDLIAHRDADAPAPRPGTPVPVAFPLGNRSQAIAQYVAAASNHDNYHGFWGRGKGVVGFNNLGEVQIVSPPTGDTSVIQTLWWRIGSTATAAPLTRMVVPLTITPVDAPLYGALDLREGDKDASGSTAPTYAGVSRTDLMDRDYVRVLQRDLRELGILMDRANDGIFGRFTRWAVRELQGYAKMATVARESQPPTTTLTVAMTASSTVVALATALPTGTLARLRIEDEILEVASGVGTTITVVRGRQGTAAVAHAAGATVAYLDRWSARLQPQANPIRYDGPVSGVVNARTRAVIARWKRDRLRCPVVVEAWEGTSTSRTRMHRTAAAGTEPERPAENVWRPEEVGISMEATATVAYTGPTVFVRDLSTHFDRPATRPADGPADSALSVLGTNMSYAPKTTLGPVADPIYELYWPEAEILPDRLIPNVAPGATLAALDAQALSTFKVVRAVAEVEAVGAFDGINAYDDAFVSMGLCHWTAGQVTPGAASQRPSWTVKDGELWAFFAYLRAVNPAVFARVVGHFGIMPDRVWRADGKRGTPSLWEPTHRKYVARGAATDEGGVPGAMNGRPPGYGQNWEYEYLRTWHWFYRFSMAGRSSAGWRQAMWDMARMRLRDILDGEWNNPAITSGNFPLNAGTRIRDVFKSERTIALIYRWHIFDPKVIFTGTPGAASPLLHKILRDASTAGPAFGPDPAIWTNNHEQSLANSIVANAPAGSWLVMSLNNVAGWPTWTLPGGGARHFTLDVSVLAAGERRLKVTRTPAADAFQFDARGLP